MGSVGRVLTWVAGDRQTSRWDWWAGGGIGGQVD